MPPARRGRAACCDPVRAPSAAGGQGGDLVGGLDRGGRGEGAGEGPLLAQVAPGGAAAGEGGGQAGHGGTPFQRAADVRRESDRGGADTGSVSSGLLTT